MPTRRKSKSSQRTETSLSTSNIIKTPTPLSILPNEVLSIIINRSAYIDRPSLSRLSRASRQMNDIAAPLLYKKIVLGPDPNKDSRRDCHPKAAKGYRPNLDTRKWKLLAGAEQVTVHPHPSWECSKTAKLHDVETLRFELSKGTPEMAAFDVLPSIHLYVELYYDIPCMVVNQLRPEKLIIRAGCIVNFAAFRTCLPPLTTSGVQDFVSILTDKRPHDCFRFQPQYVKNIKRFVIIVQTASPEETARLGSESIAIDLTEAIISMYSTSAVDFIIVNTAGLIEAANLRLCEVREIAEKNPNLTDFELDQLTRQETFMSTFWELFEKTHTNFCDHLESEEDGEREMERHFNIRFMTMREYIDNENWSGEFEYNEIAPWLRIGIEEEE